MQMGGLSMMMIMMRIIEMMMIMIDIAYLMQESMYLDRGESVLSSSSKPVKVKQTQFTRE